jgi:hypothetical protein
VQRRQAHSAGIELICGDDDLGECLRSRVRRRLLDRNGRTGCHAPSCAMVRTSHALGAARPSAAATTASTACGGGAAGAQRYLPPRAQCACVRVCVGGRARACARAHACTHATANTQRSYPQLRGLGPPRRRQRVTPSRTPPTIAVTAAARARQLRVYQAHST